ncbi:MAG: MBL fold metallo-hydrolase [Halobacteriales archaeon]|nr:MBL fold metallo-hydrolase [Halobacteriales archaeon]
MTIHHDGLTLDWYGYATLRATTPDGPVVYTDPGRYGVLTGEWTDRYGDDLGDDYDHPRGDPYEAQDGDVVLVTHDHHYDSDGIRRVAAPDATVVVYEAVDASGIDRDVEPVADLPYDIVRVDYGDQLTAAGVDIDVIPAYNRSDGPRADPDGNVGHPRGFGCGFRFTIDDRALFWPGDSDAVVEQEGLDVSVFVPPLSQELTMGAEEASTLAATLDPDLTVPIHYNTFELLAGDSTAYTAAVADEGVPVALDESNRF